MSEQAFTPNTTPGYKAAFRRYLQVGYAGMTDSERALLDPAAQGGIEMQGLTEAEIAVMKRLLRLVHPRGDNEQA